MFVPAVHDAVLDAGGLQPGAAFLVLIGPVAVDRPLVAADQPVGDRALVDLGRGQHDAPDQARAPVDADMRPVNEKGVAEEGLAVLLGPVGIGLLGMARAGARRAPRRAPGRGHKSGVHQGPPADHQPLRIELAADLLESGFQKRARLFPKPPDRGVVRRRGIQRKAAEAPERQPVLQGLLQSRVRQVVERLQIQRLEHRQRVVGRTAGPRSIPGLSLIRRQTPDRHPVDQPVQTLQFAVPAQTRRHKRFGKPQLTPIAHRYPRTVPERRESHYRQVENPPFAEKSSSKGEVTGRYRPDR